jgi:signal peptidase II
MDNAIGDTLGGQREAAATPPRYLEFILPVVIVAVDQATKAMVRAALPLHDTVTVIPGFFNVTHALNSGAAFGFLDGTDFPYKTAIIAVIATAALIGVGIYAASLSHHQLVARIGLALIVGGAAGNLIDRVLTGSVVDFADFYVRGWHFWAFNVADSAISIGVTMLILDMLTTGPHVSKTV